MLPTLNLGGYHIASYSFFIFVGIILGAVFAVQYFSKFYNIKKEDIIYCILYAIIGLGIGAKLLYIVTNIPFLINNYTTLDITDTLLKMLTGGFVFYGGLIGGVLGIFIYSKQFKISFKDLLLILLPTVPLVHSIGRIGCFFAGCCYGIEYNGIGAITFYNSDFAPNGIPLFPTQIIESICLFIIFIILLVFYKKFLNTTKIIGLYCVMYSMTRFTIEFFRGDVIRGIYLNLSTSQWISIIIFIIGIIILLKKTKNIKT